MTCAADVPYASSSVPRSAIGREGKKNERSFDILMVGIGGQGTILASNILGEACLIEGRPVKRSGDAWYGTTWRIRGEPYTD